MAKIVVKDSEIYIETRTCKLVDVSPGRAIKIDNPEGMADFYIVNKVTKRESIIARIGMMFVTNFRTGRIVEKPDHLIVTPISAEVFLTKAP